MSENYQLPAFVMFISNRQYERFSAGNTLLILATSTLIADVQRAR